MDIKNLFSEIQSLYQQTQTLTDQLNKAVSLYQVYQKSWFLSVTNRYFGHQTDLENPKEIENLYSKVTILTKEEEGVTITDYYSLYEEWLLTSFFYLENLGEEKFQSHCDFFTCYGEESSPVNMPLIDLKKEISC